MASTTIVLKEPTSENETLIYLLFRFNNQRIKYSTGQKIHPKFWNPEKQRAKETKSFSGYAELNTMLKNYEDAALNIYRTLLNDKQIPTVQKIKDALDDVFKTPLDNNSSKEFFGFIDNFISTSNKKLNTVKQYKQAQRVLTEYQAFSKTSLTFDSIDLAFYDSFTKYLTEKGYFTNSIGGFIKNLKVFMNEALERGLTKNVGFKSKRFRKVNEESESIYLSATEITKLYNLDLVNNERLLNVRDLFVIGCYTGLRFTDLSKLTENNLIDNKTKIKILTEKTNELVIIPLHPYIKAILERHNGRIPRVISNQKMNQYLKELGKEAKIDEPTTLHFTKGGKTVAETSPKSELITVHTARRSFATNAYLSDIPSISIMKITGHRTEKAFLKYIKISQEDNANKLVNHPFFK